MQDLLLWRYLRQATLPPPATLLPLLEELAQEALNHRLAFFSVLDRVLSHADAAIRAAGVRILSGARGVPAWTSLVAALKDPQTLVRLAAVEALRVSATQDPARWVHALYHPDPLVRRRADELGAPPGFANLFAAPGSFEGWESDVPEPPLTNYGSPLPADLHTDVNNALANPTNDNLDILENFLDRGTGDDREWRTTVAVTLSYNGRAEAILPVLAAGLAKELMNVESELLHSAARGVVTAGIVDFEYTLTDILYDRNWQDADYKALVVLLTQATHLDTRYWARDRMWMTLEQTAKQSRLARVFAWGVEMGKLLTGTRFQIEMLVNDSDLGYTRLRENKLHITPLPILRGERNGPQVVRGLILHEYGHHLFHKGPDAEIVWEQAANEGLGRLLNLVTDEHLERNLRQRNRRYGDLLKILNAYAFQYNHRELPVDSLLRYLGPHVQTVLPRLLLGVAHKLGHVVVGSGRFLREMEEQGHGFARFMRALRMGLGNRTSDPRVAEALALFKGSFRKSTMPQLLDIARRLREIFGNETDILDDFGLERALAGNELDWLANGAGINPDALRQQIDGLLKPEPQPNERGEKGKENVPAAWGLNMRPEETFRTINNVVKLQPNPARRADYARRVARAARRLSRYFHDLGLGWKTDRGRLQGQHLDRARIRALVLKGDPRLLTSRKMQRLTDLFLGVAIDCSGSMAGDKLEKAKLFGILLAEALQGQRGVDLRLFGFTDQVIFDAGDARRCAVESLETSGGNNDAAALWHVFQIARASPRKAKLLVMISDGIPTDCSVAALKALVLRLTRWGYCAAQVAVQPLEHICFPHYVLLQDQDFDAAVRKFGEVVMRLVGQALGR